MTTTAINEPKKGEFFQLQPDVGRGGKGHGVVFKNLEALLTPPRRVLLPRAGGFPPLRETPYLIYDSRKGAPPEDLEGGMSGYWLVSDRLRDVMDAVDPRAFEFADVDYRLADGSQGPRYFLCDVVRKLDALNEEASLLEVIISDDYEGGKHYSLAGGTRLSFSKDIVGNAHVFRLAFHGGVFCDRVFKEAVQRAGIATAKRSNGLWFYDVVNR